MFGLGFWEIIVILLMVIVFVKPKDLPRFARKIGRYYGKFRDLSRYLSSKIRDFEDEFPSNTIEGSEKPSKTEENNSTKQSNGE